MGTSSAIAPSYEALGAENAVVLAVMCATFGMVFASLCGGPVARALIKRYHLHGTVRTDESETEAVVPLNGKSLLSSVCLIIVSAGLGSYIAILAGRIPYIEFPYFIGCMIGGVIVRNILDAVHVKVRPEELDAFGDLCLEIFLGMTMMTIDVTKLAGAFGPFVLIFAAQVIFTCLWAYFITFRTCGRNYDAAVIAAGHIGMGLGNGPNTMANEKAVMAEHGFSQRRLGRISSLWPAGAGYFQPHLLLRDCRASVPPLWPRLTESCCHHVRFQIPLQTTEGAELYKAELEKHFREQASVKHSRAPRRSTASPGR